MQVVFSMVPLPITAEQKFHEAAFFYNQMIASVNNTRVFPFNLSAFLSALRSTTFYLQVQYGHDPRFKDWYTDARRRMKDDELLKMLSDLRTETIHQNPVNLLIRSGPNFHENPIVATQLEITHTADPNGNIVFRYRVGHDGEEQHAEAVTDWAFERGEVPVLQTCHHGLKQIHALLVEVKERFGSAFDENSESKCS